MNFNIMGAETIDHDVTPNRRGARSREIVLDAAERLMSEHGFDAASVAAITETSGIPPSSIYHYFGSKTGILLAVMERGSQRFFADVPLRPVREGTPLEHISGGVETIRAALAEHPDFLRLLVTLTVQPPTSEESELVRGVVNRIRLIALTALRAHLALARPAEDPALDDLSRFALAMVDGAVVAQQAEPQQHLMATLSQLPAAMVALHDAHPQRPPAPGA